MLWLSTTAERVIEDIRNGRYYHDPHAYLRQDERLIDDYLVEEAIGFDEPEIIETEPHYWQGPAILIRAIAKNRVLHVFCTIHDWPLFVTVYYPQFRQDIWEPGTGYRKRRKK